LETRWIPILDLLGARTRVEVPVTLTQESFERLNLHPFIGTQVLKRYKKVNDVRVLEARWR